VVDQNWTAPLYWHKRDGQRFPFTLAGPEKLDWHEPVCHVSFKEAEAFARWAGRRLPTEFEWEYAIANRTDSSPLTLLSSSGSWCIALQFNGLMVHPQCNKADHQVREWINAIGNLWEWTNSSYSPYPGYRPSQGALGEYNGKFMCNRLMLRRGSCATPSALV
jgi:formylglycine-generating enzyme required for sulfatase activity